MKKKILMIHHSGLIGGASMSFYYTWKALLAKYDIVAYVADDPNDFSEFLHGEGLKHNTFNFRLAKITYYSGGNSLINFKFWYHAVRIIPQIRYWKSVFNKEKPDLIIVNSKVLCWMGEIVKDYKSICFVRETIRGNKNNIANNLLKKYLEKFTAVSFITDYDLKETNLKNANSFVTRDFMNISKYEDKYGKIGACNRLKVDHDKFNILFVGGINDLKGIDIALEAISKIEDSNINLLIAGNSINSSNNQNFIKRLINKVKNLKTLKFQKNIYRFIQDNKLENVVKFIGVHSDISIPYSACDLLILPIKKPHQARPIFEIGVQRKTLIISDFPNLYDSVRNNYNGLTFQPNNSQDLADKIMLLRNNNELMIKLGQNNYELSIKNHNQNIVIKELLNEIEKTLGREG